LLKLSVQNGADALHLLVEGRLVHPWTRELETLWNELNKTLGARQLFLNLCGTTFIDRNGMQLLRSIVKAHNPIILADSPLTRQFAEQARQAEA